MTSVLQWLPLTAGLLAAGALTGSVVGAALLTASRRVLSRVAPRVRFILLGALCALPTLLGLLFFCVAFAPSVLDTLGLVADHCRHHLDHAFHLCFIHGTAPAARWPLVAGLAMLAAMVPVLLTEIVCHRRAAARIRNLKAIARHDAAHDVWLLESHGAAFTLGTWRPVVFICEPAPIGLAPKHYAAVLAHEREHAERRDALLRSVARVLTSLHLPAVRRALLQELELAAEQACDEAAARAVGDRLTVAEAIVAIARMRPPPPPIEALGFGYDDIEARIHAMLVPRRRAPRGALVVTGSLVLAALGVMFTNYERLHHDLELVLSYLV